MSVRYCTISVRRLCVGGGQWTKGRKPATGKKVALFAGCLVNYQATDVGKAAVQVLEKNNVHVVLPDQSCCGMPSFDIGDTAAMVAAAERTVASLKPWVDQGYDVVIPTPSCSLMIKREYANLLEGRGGSTSCQPDL